MAKLIDRAGTIIEATGDVAIRSKPEIAEESSRDAMRAAALTAAAAGDDFRIVSVYELDDRIAEPGVAAARSSDAGTVHLQTTRAPDEREVVLLINDDIFEWIAPEPVFSALSTEASRGGYFDLRGGAPLGQGGGFRASGRGGRIFRKATAYLLRWVKKPLANLFIRHADGDGPFGLFRITSQNLERWSPDTGNRVSRAPARPGRVLILVHGTFTNTHDNYGPLTDPRYSELFIDKAFDQYSEIWGFDHPTLSADIAENARDLAAALARLDAREPVEFDIVGYSRGGLVIRHLLERELTNDMNFRLRKAIFIGSPLGGTGLANPENWSRLLATYTNVLAGAVAAFSFAFGAPQVGRLLGGVLAVLRRLVEFVVETGTTGNNVPGLASMRPGSELITVLHDEEYPELPRYHAITSNFEPSGTFADSFGARLKQRLLDLGADQLFRGANDLVVDQSSMTAIDPVLPISARTLAFGREDGVYHTIYFSHPKTHKQLAEWLLEDSGATRAAPIAGAAGARVTSAQVGGLAGSTSVRAPAQASAYDPTTEPTGRKIVYQRQDRPGGGREMAQALAMISPIFMSSSGIASRDSAVASAAFFSRMDGPQALMFENDGVAIIDEQAGASAADARSAVATLDPERFVVRDEYLVSVNADLRERGRAWLQNATDLLVDYVLQDTDGGGPRPSPAGGGAEEPSRFEARGGDGFAWHVNMIGGGDAAGGKDIKVAVLDSGVDVEHPDLVHALRLGDPQFCANFVDPNRDPLDVNDEFGHGTHVAGLVAGRPDTLYGEGYGVSPGVRLMIAKVLDNDGFGPEGRIIQGMIWARDNDAQIINLSLGRTVLTAADQRRDEAGEYANIAKTCIDRGCLVVAAAGNQSRRRERRLVAPVNAPANVEHALAVAAIDRFGAIADFSNGNVFGGGGVVNLAAPGVEVWSAAPGRRMFRPLPGTSMATPIVSGAAARIALATGLRGKDLLVELLNRTRSLGHPSSDQGNGLVQI